MKKVLLIIALVVMALSLTQCGMSHSSKTYMIIVPDGAPDYINNGKIYLQNELGEIIVYRPKRSPFRLYSDKRQSTYVMVNEKNGIDTIIYPMTCVSDAE